MRKYLRWISYIFLSILILWALLSGLTFYYLYNEGSKSPHSSTPSEPPLFLQVKNMRLTMSDGVVLEGWLIHHDTRAPLVWIIPDFNESMTDWTPWLSLLYDSGYSVVVMNHRGLPPSLGKFVPGERAIKDVREISRNLMMMAGLEKRWAILGHGLGAAFALQALCDAPPVRILIVEDPVLTFTERLILPLDKRWKLSLTRTLPWWTRHSSILYRYTDMNADIAECYDRYGQDKPHTVVFKSHGMLEEYVKHFYGIIPEPKELIPIPVPATEAIGQAEMNRYQRVLFDFLERSLPPKEKTIMVH